MYYLFLSLLIIVTIISYYLTKKDLLSPPFILCLVYLFCSVVALYNYELWEMSSFSINTINIIVFSLIVFLITGTILQHLLFMNRKKESLYKVEETNKIVKIDDRLILLSSLFGLLTIFLCVKNVIDVGGLANGWSNAVNIYKVKINSGEFQLPEYVDLFIKILDSIAYIFLYVFCVNTACGGKKSKNIKYLIPVLLYLVRSICTGTRYNIISVVAAFVYGYYILYSMNRKVKKSKIFCYGIIVVFFVYFSFIVFKRAAGRTDNISPLYYLSMYTSGSIKLFDEYIKSPIPKSDIFGKETFSGMNIFWALRGFGTMYDINLEFRFVNGVNLGNVYGALRRYYQDFGFVGCLALVALSSIIWNYIYYKIKYDRKRKHEFLTIIFMIMVNALVIFPIDDKLFNNIFTFSFIEKIIITYFLYYIIIKKRASKKSLFTQKSNHINRRNAS